MKNFIKTFFILSCFFIVTGYKLSNPSLLGKYKVITIIADILPGLSDRYVVNNCDTEIHFLADGNAIISLKSPQSISRKIIVLRYDILQQKDGLKLKLISKAGNSDVFDFAIVFQGDTAILKTDNERNFKEILVLEKLKDSSLENSINLPDAIKHLKENEATTLISSINTAQTAYYTEFNTFATDYEKLQLGLPLNSANYNYVITGGMTKAFVTAAAKTNEINSYTGAVFQTQKNGDNILVPVICETDTPSKIPPALPRFDGSKPTCPTGSHKVATKEDLQPNGSGLTNVEPRKAY